MIITSFSTLGEFRRSIRFFVPTFNQWFDQLATERPRFLHLELVVTTELFGCQRNKEDSGHHQFSSDVEESGDNDQLLRNDAGSAWCLPL